MNDNEKTEAENAINRKLDALKEVVTGLVKATIRLQPEIALDYLKEAWKKEEEDD